MNDQSLTVREAGAVDIVRPKPVDIEALLIAAMEKGPDVVERMMVVRRELKAEAAKSACDEAVRDFQRKCPRIGKTKGVPDKYGNTSYRYTPMEEIIKVISPILNECGLSYSFDTDVNSQPNWVIAICDIAHVGGHSFRKQAKFPLGTKTNIMSDTQQYSAALSFANRRVLCNALGIVTVGDDKDGQEAWNKTQQHGPGGKTAEQPKSQAEPAEKELKNKLWAILKDVRGDGASWMEAAKWLRGHNILDEGKTVASLTAAELKIVIEKAEIQLGL